MELTKDKLNVEDEVYCIFNHAIKGRITKKTNHHGMWLYHVKVDDEKNFRKFIGLKSDNAMFLHYQLRKFYKEVKKDDRKSKKRASRAKRD